jgi:aerobic C4-dicarboxylate transport protein
VLVPVHVFSGYITHLLLPMKRIFKSLYVQVLIAIFTGIVLGYFFPAFAIKLKPLGDAFIKLIKMMIAPVIFCTIVTGIAGMQDMKKVGRVGLKAILYFEVVSTLALIIGLITINLLHPGTGINANLATIDATQVQGYVASSQTGGVVSFLTHIIPENIVDALDKGDLLQVLFFAVLFGFGLSKIGAKAQPILKGIQSLSEGLFAVIGIIMKVAPLGAFGAMAFTIGQYGVGTLASLAKLMGTFYLTCILFIFLVLGLIMRLYGYRIIRLLSLIKEELLVVLGTSSS